ncbi:regulator of G-protein signaling 12 isoform X16 [Hydra vulgaris]|uniref:Regulator of G-protein signaling 12 isoform X16 n=2 Tax=Hydra vulgaris TaxID=6087 RepID=A0ABM4BIF4_HYDVU
MASTIIRTVNLKRSKKGLGFIISNQFPCIISCVNQNTPAFDAGLKSGDEILEINSIDVSQFKHNDVVKTILCNEQPHILIKVRTFYSVSKDFLLHGFNQQVLDITHLSDHGKNKKNYTLEKNSKDCSTVVSNSYCEERKANVQHSEITENDVHYCFENISTKSSLKRSPSQPVSIYYPPIYNVALLYYCSVDIPHDINLKTSSDSTINDCISKIKKKLNNKPVLVHLQISKMGIKLINPFGNEIVTYPLRTIIFSNIYAEDKRFFSFVTQNSLLDHSLTTSLNSIKKFVKSKIVCLYACHVFMVESKLSVHSDHKEFADVFKIACTPSLKFDGCQEFPPSPSYVLQELNAFFKERKNVRKGVQSFCFASTDEFLSTPEEDVIYNTLEKIQKSSLNSPSRNTQKLMVSPPCSLQGINEDEKLCLIKEIQQNNNYSQKIRKNISWIKGNEFSKKLFPSKRMEYKKPPVPRKISCATKSFGFTKIISSEQKGSNIKNQENKKLFGLFNSTEKCKEQVSSDIKKERSSSDSMVSDNSTESFSDISSRKGTPPTNPKHSVKSPEKEKNVHNKKVELWSCSFESLLADIDGVKCFQEFLKKEFSEENLMFWKACNDFLKLKDINKIKECAKEIFDNYLSPKAPFLVNVNLSICKRVEQQLDSPNTDLFVIPQQQVFQLMKFDSYPRFIKSDWFKERVNRYNADNSSKENLKKLNQSFEQEEKNNVVNFRTGKVKSPELKSSRAAIHKERSFSTSIIGHNTIGASPSNIKDFQLWDGPDSSNTSGLLRIMFPDGTSRIFTTNKGVSLREALKDVLEKKNIVLSSYDVTIGQNGQICNLDVDATLYKDTALFLEKRVLFRFDLPNNRSVGIKSNPNKTLHDILQPVMKKNGFDISNFNILLFDSKSCLALNTIIKNVENKRLVTKRAPKKQSSQSSLDSAKSPVLSDFRASFRKFRSASFVKDEKNVEEKFDQTLTKKFSNEMKHLILGRSKSAGPDSTAALLNVIKKSQSNRIEDQRGVIIGKQELPDFLKVSTSSSPPVLTRSFSVTASPTHLFKDAAQELHTKLSQSTTTFCSIQSWSDIPAIDRSIIDTSFLSKDSINSNLSQNSDHAKDDVNLFHSDPNLMKSKLIRKNSAPPITDFNVQKKDFSQSLKTEISNESRLGFTNVSMPPRPKPINALDEIAILKALNEDSDFEVLEIPSDTLNDSFYTPNGSFTDNSFIANFTPPTPLCTRLASTSNPECSEVSYRSSVELERGNFFDYAGVSHVSQFLKDQIHIRDSSIVPMTTSATFSVHESIFETNSIPTPEKSKLLNGETIRGRQNEKISFV